MSKTSWNGFHKRSLSERLQRISDWAGLSRSERDLLTAASGLPMDVAQGFVENVVGTFPLPLGVAVGFTVDDEDVVVPMAVEESSVIAAASHGAKMAAAGGGFVTESMNPVTIGQVELRDVPDPAGAASLVEAAAPHWIGQLHALIPGMVSRGGGIRAFRTRVLDGNRVVLHVHVDTRDAMGANVVNTLCEALCPLAVEVLGGRPGLRILSNLATERVVTARCTVPATALGGADVVRAIVEANDFALVDPYRAATHNKGILNGIDPLVIATGNDWRAVEAGAHAFAAMEGSYRALTQYHQNEEGDLEASLTLPMSLGVVGGVTRLHPVAQVCLKILGNPDAMRLARIAASVGLAQNLSALRALATTGIQEGHMRLHARNLALQAGLRGEAASRVAEQMVEEGQVSAKRARELAAKQSSV